MGVGLGGWCLGFSQRVIGGFAKWDVPDLVWVMVASFVRNDEGLSLDDGDDEISEEDLARLEQELAEALEP
uniref:Uncharacterized protein n=1 Tax=Fagus sylvatica TaxID=28930 RepID=A0A2N9J740_FAGSY